MMLMLLKDTCLEVSLIMANTMMRNGELYGLTWENVEQYEEDKKFALISVWADTSKTPKVLHLQHEVTSILKD